MAKHLIRHKVNPMAVPGILNSGITNYYKEISIQNTEDVRKDAVVLANAMNFTIDELAIRRRDEYLVDPRRICCYLLYEKYKGTLRCAEATIGEVFHRDRTSILSAMTRASNLIDTEPNYRARVERLKKLI